ncbi:thiol-disulfide oxidoreductase ResA [Evansella sp. AB-rgal1]|uniref:thiol-disulfide oxidoreductase ResA n=1 Tax=Evansella sp. AB-rgal1 TaxID=3242696 RepID=UPI00359DBC67
MKQKRLIIRSSILLIMVIAIGYTLYNHLYNERGLVDRNDVAPNFKVEDLDGNIIELEELRGKGVYLNFWATYCVYCRQKMEVLRDNYEEYREQGIEIVSVNVNEQRLRIERHADRFNINYPLYLDQHNLVRDAYGVVSLPSTFLIDENGIVIERQIGGRTESQVLASLEKLIPNQ